MNFAKHTYPILITHSILCLQFFFYFAAHLYALQKSLRSVIAFKILKLSIQKWLAFPLILILVILLGVTLTERLVQLDDRDAMKNLRNRY